jgi:hypothetical protein
MELLPVTRPLALLFGIFCILLGTIDGQSQQIATTGAVAYQRHPFVILFLSKTEVAHGTGHYNIIAASNALRYFSAKQTRVE